MTTVAVLGAGSWGTTFAKVLADGGSDVMVWARRSEVAKEIHETRRNSDYLPGINLPKNLDATDSLERAVGRHPGLCGCSQSAFAGEHHHRSGSYCSRCADHQFDEGCRSGQRIAHE